MPFDKLCLNEVVSTRSRLDCSVNGSEALEWLTSRLRKSSISLDRSPLIVRHPIVLMKSTETRDIDREGPVFHLGGAFLINHSFN